MKLLKIAELVSLKLLGNNAGADRILTSDADGDATWGRKITHGTTAPTSPQTGDIWLDTT